MATIGTVIVVTGLLTGTGSAIGQQNERAHFTYTCQFPSGARPVGVDIALSFPSSGAIGQAISPAGGTVTMTIPHTAMRDLTGSNATTVSGIGQLATTVAQNGRSEKADWANLVASSKPIPATGGLTLTAPSTAPTITPRAPGDITVTAATLTMVLTPRTADGFATDPATVAIDCTLNAGQQALLATVPVPAATATPGAGSNGLLAVEQAPGTERSARALDTAATPADCGIVPGVYPVDTLGIGLCGFLSGFSNVNKLDAAALIGPKGAFINAFGPYETAIKCEPDTTLTIPQCFQAKETVHSFTCSFAQFEDNGEQFQLPPTRSTFLAFGFVPVTATMHLSEAEWPPDHRPMTDPQCQSGAIHVPIFKFTMPKRAVLVTADGVNAGATATSHTTLETYLDVRISDATVNGVPLNVGTDCHTAQPVHSLTTADGKTINFVQTGYTFVSGGPVTGTIDIPSFTGCGVDENLDPLFDASVSGNDNFLHLTQGTLCAPSVDFGCPPTVPTPVR